MRNTSKDKIQPGDILRIFNNGPGRGYHVYRVTSIKLGIVGQENLIGLECLDKQSGYSGKETIREMLVPEPLIKQNPNLTIA